MPNRDDDRALHLGARSARCPESGALDLGSNTRLQLRVAKELAEERTDHALRVCLLIGHPTPQGAMVLSVEIDGDPHPLGLR